MAHRVRPAPAPVAAETAELYERDFAAWAERTAADLRARRFDAVDIERVAEEVEDMGKRDLKEINSRLQVLLLHLLKWRLQPDKRSASWQSTIVTQRLEIEALLEMSPSLRTRLATGLARNHAGAVKRALPETGLDERDFPSACPFLIEQILDEGYLPT